MLRLRAATSPFQGMLNLTGRMKTANYTERAMAGVHIPNFVYVPAALRPGVKFAKDANDVLRLEAADPIGFNIAIMNGQPIPQFTVIDNQLKVHYFIPDFEQRQRAAEFLARRVNKTKDQPTDDFAAAVERAASNELGEAAKAD